MRLIDTDNIFFHCNYDGDCTGDIDDCKECGNYICDFRDIQEQPTAYDIDKVVEELEKSSKWVNETNEYCDDDGNDYIPLSKAIEIVKQGGVGKDVK